jgi:hypothetical protein
VRSKEILNFQGIERNSDAEAIKDKHRESHSASIRLLDTPKLRNCDARKVKKRSQRVRAANERSSGVLLRIAAARLRLVAAPDFQIKIRSCDYCTGASTCYL